MSYGRILGVGLTGLTGHLIEVQADLRPGRPAMVLNGLAGAAVHEARDRIRAGLVNSGLAWPSRRITVNLLPADLPKHGTGLDAAIAAALLTAAGELPFAALDGAVVIGELGLDGALRPVRGVVPMVIAAVQAGVSTVFVPLANAREAAVVPGVAVHAVDSLRTLVDVLRGGSTGRLVVRTAEPAGPQPGPDDAEIVVPAWGGYGIEVAAAGGHHLALIGRPGSGKTLLAEQLHAILPPLDDEEALEVTALHSLAGLVPADGLLMRRPPWQAPPQAVSAGALLGSGLTRPGLLSLAHRGLLFVDQAREVPGAIVQMLRQPLETGRVVLGTARGTVEYPARFQLVIAARPCPCGATAGEPRCGCGAAVQRCYLARLTGPLLDRIDVRLTAPEQTTRPALGSAPVTRRADLAGRVAQARRTDAARWAAHGWRLNAEVPGPHLRQARWRLPPADTTDLRTAVDRGLLSLRGYDAVLRPAWSINDLRGADRPDRDAVATALELRTGLPADPDRRMRGPGDDGGIPPA